MTNQYSDLTLAKFLERILGSKLLSGADHVALSAVDMPDEQSTLADHVSRDQFEHIRIRFPSSLNLEQIMMMVVGYYAVTGHKFLVERQLHNGFMLAVSIEGRDLGVTCAIEGQDILNIVTA